MHEDLEEQGQVLDIIEKNPDLVFIVNLYRQIESFEGNARLRASDFKTLRDIRDKLASIVKASCPDYIRLSNIEKAIRN